MRAPLLLASLVLHASVRAAEVSSLEPCGQQSPAHCEGCLNSWFEAVCETLLQALDLQSRSEDDQALPVEAPSQLATQGACSSASVAKSPSSTRKSPGVTGSIARCHQAWLAENFGHTVLPYELPLVHGPRDLAEFGRSIYVPEARHDFFFEQGRRHQTVVETQGDGNCFYRAFAVGLVCLAHKDSARALRLLSLIDAERQESTSDVARAGLELLGRLVCESPEQETLDSTMEVFNKRLSSDAIVYGLREIVSRRARLSVYRPFITEDLEVHIKSEILRMGSWGGQIEILALARAFGVSVTIVNMQFGQRNSCDDNVSPDTTADVELLYNGVHYDLYV